MEDMKIMCGNKYENTMYEWYEKLAKAEKRLQDSIKCNEAYGGNEEWIKEDAERVENIRNCIEQVKAKLAERNIDIDYGKVQNSVRI